VTKRPDRRGSHSQSWVPSGVNTADEMLCAKSGGRGEDATMPSNPKCLPLEKNLSEADCEEEKGKTRGPFEIKQNRGGRRVLERSTSINRRGTEEVTASYGRG